jgi:hypothetical protein
MCKSGKNHLGANFLARAVTVQFAGYDGFRLRGNDDTSLTSPLHHIQTTFPSSHPKMGASANSKYPAPPSLASHLLKIRNKAANAAVYQNQLPIFYDKRLSGKNPPACNRQS